MELSQASKLAIIDSALEQLGAAAYRVSIDKRVAEKCGKEDGMKRALLAEADITAQIRAYQDIRAELTAKP